MRYALYTRRERRLLVLLLLAAALFQGRAHSQGTPTDSRQKKGTSVPAALEAARQRFWDHPPRPTGWVNDYEGLFTGLQKEVLDSLIGDFKTKTSVEIAPVTVDSTRASQERFDALALHLHNVWGVGVKGTDNGMLILISKGLRRIRVSNGAGVRKVLSDSRTKEIIDTDFLPHFRKGDFYTGTLTGLKALIKNF